MRPFSKGPSACPAAYTRGVPTGKARPAGPRRFRRGRWCRPAPGPWAAAMGRQLRTLRGETRSLRHLISLHALQPCCQAAAATVPATHLDCSCSFCAPCGGLHLRSGQALAPNWPASMANSCTMLYPLCVPPAGEVAGVEDAAELARFVRGHAATDAEVKALCKDLQVRHSRASAGHAWHAAALAWAQHPFDLAHGLRIALRSSPAC